MANPTFVKDFYHISSVTLLQILDTLHDHTFSIDGEIKHNDVIATCKLLEIEMAFQEPKEGPECAD